MTKKGLFYPIWNKKKIRKIFEDSALLAEVRIVNMLQRTGEEFVKVARLSGQYKDHTGNLRSSIGYVIVRDGKVIDRNFQLSEKEGTDKVTGMRTAQQLASELIKEYSKGYVLIGMAGMKYAVFVEAMENKDVVSYAANRAEDFIKEYSRLLFKRLNKK
ncbi:hypothetical protein [Parabacteroides sp. Marseille-P3160]|uniref:hypothetical protein n=1 Tax=Parabacteroides sp. Marseille-P3160 TaxID=1917887 RepID=UPI0009BA70C9|nr:hypothetical protein [Parabacteroides sp. Marseille-P3160]